MDRTPERLKKIFDKTDGACHLCHSKLNFSDYGKGIDKNGWEIEHSNPKAKGGTDHINNLYSACKICNLKKGTKSSCSSRKDNGVKGVPYSRKQKNIAKKENTLGGTILGVVIGLPFGPLGVLIAGAIGGTIGNQVSPKTND